MTDPLAAIGATTPGRQVLLLTCLFTGVVLLLTFLVPSIGTVLSARLIVLAAVAFMGSGLTYLSLLPVEQAA